MRTCRIMAQVGVIPIAILILFINLTRLKYQEQAIQKEKLILLQVIFANGEQELLKLNQLRKTPMASDTEIYWLNTNSVLSLRGQKRSYKLGKAIKNLYQLYLHKTEFSHEIVYSVTGYLNILQTTLQCVHAGIFPTFSGPDMINIDLDWRPVPYEILSPNNTMLYKNNITKDLKTLMTDSIGEKEIMSFLSKVLQFDVTLSDVPMIHEYLQAKLKSGETLKNWEKEIYPNQTSFLVNEFWNQFAITYRNSTGPLLKLLLNNIQNKISGEMPEARRLHLFASHRLNIVGLLSALGIWNIDPDKQKVVNACSYVLVEFVQDIDNKKNFRIYFYFQDGNDLEHPVLVISPHCANTSCSLEEFTNIVNNLMTEE